jgi:hypothetical protein
MAAKGKKPQAKGKKKGPDTRGIQLDDAGRFKVKEGELSDETLDRVSGGTIWHVPPGCLKDPPKKDPPILRVCCQSVKDCKTR